MNNYNDPNNIMGMAKILAGDNDDIDLIEKSIIEGADFQKNEEPYEDLAKKFGEEMDQIDRYNIADVDTTTDLYSTDLTGDMFNKSKPEHDTDFGFSAMYTPTVTLNDRNSDGDDNDNNGDDNDNPVYTDTKYSSFVSEPNYHKWKPTSPVDKQLHRMTDEERKQSHIRNVLGDIDIVETDNTFIEREDEEDEMVKILEHIDGLYTQLDNEGVDLSRIQKPTMNTSYNDAKRILRILQIKNDRARYCDMFEEGILACAFGLEHIFDGKNEWFGKKIDLVGYSDTVKVKLRRMRYDTSSFVSNIVQGYAIGHGWRIIFELIPSLFLYSKERNNRKNDNLISEISYTTHMNNLHDT